MLPAALLQRLDEALSTVTRGASRQRRHRARLDDAGVELSMPGFWVLHELCRAGPMAMTTLAEAADVPVPHASREVKALVDAGMATRAADPGDQRVVVVAATAAGRKAAEAYRAAGRHQIEAIVRSWPRDDVDALTTLLERFAAEVRRVQQQG